MIRAPIRIRYPRTCDDSIKLSKGRVRFRKFLFKLFSTTPASLSTCFQYSLRPRFNIFPEDQ
jgi:hypothetical protein